MPQGTNFVVTPSQAFAIEDLLQSDNRPFVWWVNQGTNYDVEHHEGYVWAGSLARDGRTLDHHKRVMDLKPGECVFHYANGAIRAIGEVLESPIEAARPNQASLDEQKPGFYASIRYFDLSKPLDLQDIPLDWRTNDSGPFDRDGTVKQGYLYKVSRGFAGRLARLILERTPELGTVQPLALLADGAPTDGPRWWVEKTIVRGQPTRETGEYALGKVLWSPQHGKGGADIYRFMREARLEDVVLHLTDNSAFTGISRIAESVRDFNGVAGTEWGEGPSYLIPLEGFVKLDPVLSREAFFGQPYRDQLLQLLKSGTRNLFYNGGPKLEPDHEPKPELNQGAYFTPAPPELVSILDAAYQQIAGHTLSSLVGAESSATPSPATRPSVSPFEELVESTNMASEELEELETLLVTKQQVILEGPPGSGKTYIADKLARFFTGNPLDTTRLDRLVLVQFHQSYGYEDFVQGIRPETGQSGQLTYGVKDGIFKRFCEDAAQRPDSRFVIIIDEINRGNISRIFGELLYLLEYRDKEIFLPYAKEDDAPFSIPRNMYMIGTMNTTDRSLAQIDYALRRRFFFYQLLPVVDGRAPVLERWLAKRDLAPRLRDRLLSLFVALNLRVQQELGAQFQVGHSYFMVPGIGTDVGLRLIWRRSVMPLLTEYFYNYRNRDVLLREFELDKLLESGPTEAQAK
jgi:MoxR-like ATPase